MTREREIASEGMLAAKSAGLPYDIWTTVGICRGRRGNGFSYVNVDGKPLHDGEIPPAWRWRDSLSDFRQLVYAKRFLEL